MEACGTQQTHHHIKAIRCACYRSQDPTNIISCATNRLKKLRARDKRIEELSAAAKAATPAAGDAAQLSTLQQQVGPVSTCRSPVMKVQNGTTGYTTQVHGDSVVLGM